MSDSKQNPRGNRPTGDAGSKHDWALDELLQSAADSSDSDTPQDELAEAQRAAADAQQQVLRTQAELENVRKRMRREQEEERRYACLPLIRDLLPAIDNLDRAISSADTAKQPPGLVEGVRMVADQIIGVLAEHGCRPLRPLGEPFDPMQEEAVGQQFSDQYPQGTVMHVVQVGYMLHDRVVRPAHVIVSQGPTE